MLCVVYHFQRVNPIKLYHVLLCSVLMALRRYYKILYYNKY